MSNQGAARRFEWERVGRVIARNVPGRARYPSVVRADDGSVLVLFSQQTPEQEGVSGAAAGAGDLVLLRSGNDGQTWSRGKIVYRGRTGCPRPVGTMTRLRSGRIIVPFAEILDHGEYMDDFDAVNTFRLLSSDDDGKSWQVSDPEVTGPLSWWAPSGKVIETGDGALVMPVYGAVSNDDLEATIHNCGLLRSRDGGRSWGDFSWIARGGRAMVGAAPESRFSFEGPALAVLADGRWLALLTARRLNRAGTGPTETDEGPGTPQALCRVWSRDQGRRWTKPDQLMPGAWPSLTVVGDQTLCANTIWCAWGKMRLEVSDNGFDSLSQEVRLMERGWILGRLNRPQEAPPPPTVPYLAWPWTRTPNIEASRWPFEHYGYPCMLPLDEDRLLVVFGRTQCGTGSGSGGYDFDPPEWDDLPVKHERIQAVFFRRVVAKEKLTRPLPRQKRRRPGRWVLAERVIVEGLGACGQMPNGDLVGRKDGRMQRSSDGGRTWGEIEGAAFPEGLNAFGILRSGRWLASAIAVDGPEAVGGFTVMGMVGGYPTTKHRGFHFDRSLTISYSDDSGRTWHTGQPFRGPFKTMISPCASHFLESADGTVALPIFGIVENEEMSPYAASNGIMRSHDGGTIWGDFSYIFRTNPAGPGEFQPGPRYTEMDVVQLPNGHWVAYSRAERLGGGPDLGGTAVALSTDQGRTWTRTGALLQGISQQKGVVLPDGGIALTWRTSSWQAPGVAVTYDEGRSFEYMLTGPYETVNAFLTAKDEFVVFTGKSIRSDMSAGVCRWIPTKR